MGLQFSATFDMVSSPVKATAATSAATRNHASSFKMAKLPSNNTTAQTPSITSPDSALNAASQRELRAAQRKAASKNADNPQETPEDTPTLTSLANSAIKCLEDGAKNFTGTTSTKIKQSVIDATELIKQIKRIIPLQGFYSASQEVSAASAAENSATSTLIADIVKNELAAHSAAQIEAIKALSDTVTALSNKPPRETQHTDKQQKKSYAAITFENSARRSANDWTPVKNKKQEKKQTPKTKHLLVVKPNSAEGSGQATRAAFKQQLADKAPELGITGIRLASNHAIIVETKDPANKSKITAAFNNIAALNAAFKIEESRKKLPTMVLLGVANEGNRDKKQFVERLFAANADVAAAIGTDAPLDHCAVLFTRKARSRKGHLCDIIIKVSPQVRTAMLKSLRLSVEFEYIRVEDFISIVQCFKCCEFGHFASRCTNESVCGHCAGAHSFKDCPSKNDNSKTCCANCHAPRTNNSAHGADNDVDATIVEEPETNAPSAPQIPLKAKHSATSRNCPRLISLKKLIAERTDYGL